MKKILFVLPFRFFGGPERQTLMLTSSLARDFGVTILLYTHRAFNASDLVAFKGAAEKNGVEVISYATPPKTVFLQTTKQLKSLFEEKGCDFSVTMGYYADILGAHSFAPDKHIAMFRGWTGESLRVKLWEFAHRFYLRKMRLILCVSRQQTELLEKYGIEPSRLRQVTNAQSFTNEAEFAELKKTKSSLTVLLAQAEVANGSRVPRNATQANGPGPLWLGCVGRISPEKGQAELAEAFATLSQSNQLAQSRELQLVFVGDGPLYETLKEKYRAQTAIHFVGYQANAKQWIAQFDLFILPSHKEGLPNVVLEAFAVQTPVLANLVGGVGELVESEKTGYVMASNSPVDIATALKATLLQESKWQSVTQSARSKLLEDFSPARQCQEFTAALNSILPVDAQV